jgi:putative endonuclease
MITKQQWGKQGEEWAANFLIGKGYHIRERNWRCGHLELDLICEREGKLHVVEVKLRKASPYGAPELAVNKTKFRHLRIAGATYLRLHPQFRNISFDILSITITQSGKAEFLHIQDVFF